MLQIPLSVSVRADDLDRLPLAATVQAVVHVVRSSPVASRDGASIIEAKGLIGLFLPAGGSLPLLKLVPERNFNLPGFLALTSIVISNKVIVLDYLGLFVVINCKSNHAVWVF